MCSLRIEDKIFNVTLFCVYVPTEEADKDIKEAFYSKLEEEVGKILKHDCIIILWVLNAKPRWAQRRFTNRQ